MEEVKILWTGGWDSTFRVVELSRENVIIQPIYVDDKQRKSRDYEFKAIDEVIEALKAKKETKAEFKPLKIILKDEIPENEEISNAYKVIHERTHLGSQHDWLARLANMYPGLEIGTEAGEPETSHIIQSIQEFTHLYMKDGIGYVDKEKSTKEGQLVLGNFRYPIIEKTEKQMVEIIKKWGYEDVMQHIWFCHTPNNGEPCGICHPCCVKIESNMEFLLPPKALKKYKTYMRIKKTFGEKNADRVFNLCDKLRKKEGEIMKTYFITGGAGFIGSTLSKKLLEQGNKVVAIDNFCDFYNPIIKENNIKELVKNSEFKLYKKDIRDRQALKEIFDENQIDVVMHLAAMAGVRPSIENPVLYQDVNCMGTQNILEEMKLHNVKNGVFASSSSVYGNCKEVPFREDMIVDYAISPYAATKKSNEVMAHVYHKLYNMNIIMLRFFTVYGPKQRPDLAINKFTRLMLNNEEIPMFGDGTTSRDYTYVDDIVDGIIRSCNYVLTNTNVYEILNLGNSSPISLKQMIEIIGKTVGVEPKIKQLPMQPGDVERTYADISKAKKLIGYEPKTTFEEGINNFVQWYKENINLYN